MAHKCMRCVKVGDRVRVSWAYSAGSRELVTGVVAENTGGGPYPVLIVRDDGRFNLPVQYSEIVEVL